MSSDLPEGWQKHVSKSTGKTYYLNIYTKQSQWEPTTSSATKEKQARCSHLLVKHKESRRPSSWRETNITRTREEALELLECKTNSVKFLFKKVIIILKYNSI